jgi:hypothetical protein
MPAEIMGIGADTGSAVADATGTSESFDSGSTSDADLGIDDGIETSTDESAIDDGAADENVDPDAQVDEVGKGKVKVPATFKKLVNDLKATDPALAKYINSLSFGMKALTDAFPGGVNEAKAAKAFVDRIGGAEGLASIEAERGEWSAIDEKFANGDPAFVEALATDYPESFTKLAPSVLENLAKNAPEQYQHLMGRVLLNTLQKSPIPAIYQELNKYAETKEAAKLLADWYGGIEDLAQNVPEKKIDPERQKLEQEKSAFAQQKQKEYFDSVSKDIFSHVKSEVETEINVLSKGKKIDADSMAVLTFNIENRIGQRLNKMGKNNQYQTALASGDKNTAVKMAKQLINAGLKEDVKYIYKMFSGGSKTEPKPVAPKPVTSTSTTTSVPTVKLNKQPSADRIDYSPGRTTKDMIWDNKAYLKGKKELFTWGD